MSEPRGDEPYGVQRLDKWLWFARIVKSRTLSASLVAGGKIRVNRERVLKPSHAVKPGDVITSSAQKTVRIFKVKDPGIRRGPASEAETLYEELTPATPPPSPGGVVSSRPHGCRDAGTGRPTKRDRRQTDLLKGRLD
jgi:ribosome-associated heat shock protein Hsp15